MSTRPEAVDPSQGLLVAHVTGLLTTDRDQQATLHAITENTRSGYSAVSAAVVSTDRPHSALVESTRGSRYISDLLAVPNPGSVCARTGSVVLIDDFANYPTSIERTPDYSRYIDLAVSLGLRAVRAFPLRLSGSPVGALVVHTSSPWAAHHTALFGQTMADLAAVVLSTEDALRREVPAGSIDAIVANGTAIDQAVGVLAALHGLEADIAREWLYRDAKQSENSPAEQARRIIATLTAPNTSAMVDDAI